VAAPVLPIREGELLVKRFAVFLAVVLFIVIAPEVATAVSRAVVEAIINLLRAALEVHRG
jgi:hypothetical protein